MFGHQKGIDAPAVIVMEHSFHGRTLATRAIATLDEAARESLYREATKIAADDAAFIPIHHQVNVYAIRKGVPFHPRMTEGIRPANFLPGR